MSVWEGALLVTCFVLAGWALGDGVQWLCRRWWAGRHRRPKTERLRAAPGHRLCGCLPADTDGDMMRAVERGRQIAEDTALPPEGAYINRLELEHMSDDDDEDWDGTVAETHRMDDQVAAELADEREGL